MHKKFQEALVKKYKQYQYYIPFVVDDMQLQGGWFYLIRVRWQNPNQKSESEKVKVSV